MFQQPGPSTAPAPSQPRSSRLPRFPHAIPPPPAGQASARRPPHQSRDDGPPRGTATKTAHLTNHARAPSPSPRNPPAPHAPRAAAPFPPPSRNRPHTHPGRAAHSRHRNPVPAASLGNEPALPLAAATRAAPAKPRLSRSAPLPPRVPAGRGIPAHPAKHPPRMLRPRSRAELSPDFPGIASSARSTRRRRGARVHIRDSSRATIISVSRTPGAKPPSVCTARSTLPSRTNSIGELPQ